MRIIFVRHGEPDYNVDSLMEKGRREAELLAKRAVNWPVKDMYVSPFGRAQETAKPIAKALGITPETLPWLREFSYKVHQPTNDRMGVPWDFVSSELWKDEKITSMDEWVNVPPMSGNPEIAKNYPIVISSLDELLEKYGYERFDHYYIRKDGRERFLRSTIYDGHKITIEEYPEDDTEPTIMMVCHFGVICLMLSHLVNIPFELLTSGFYLPTSSVTIVNTEERWGKEVAFRIQTAGDCAHLVNSGEPISNAGSFARCLNG